MTERACIWITLYVSPREAETAVESNWHTETCVCNTVKESDY